jgi:hypothetical protein
VVGKAQTTRQALADGQTAISVRSGCNSYKFVGSAGISYSYAGGTADVVTPSSNSTSGIGYSTIYDNAIAVGFSKAQAEAMVANAKKTVAEVTGNSPKTKSTTSARTKKTNSVSSLPIIGSPCVNGNFNGGQATGRTCDVQTLVQSNSSGRYINDDITTSGHNGTWWNNLTNLSGNDNYAHGNNIVKWNPTVFRPTGSCSTFNEGISFDGLNLGDSETVCAAGLGPEWSDPTTGNGAEWNGCSGNTQGAPSTDVVDNPSGVSSSMVVRLNMSWAWC